MSAIVGTVGADKGGNAKTFTVLNTAGTFASYENNPKVLAIDCDPSGDLSSNFFGANAALSFRPYQTVAAIFDEEQEALASDVIHKTRIENLSIIPANDHFRKYRLPEPWKHGDLQFALRDFIQEVSGDYDVILFDTPGGMDTLPAWSALLASHFVFSPVLPEKNSCESIFTIKRLVNEAIQNGNPSLIDLGYFVCNRNSRVGLHKKREDMVRQLYGTQVFETVVYAKNNFRLATEHKKPISEYRPKSAEAQMIRDLAEEIVVRLKNSNYQEVANY